MALKVLEAELVPTEDGGEIVEITLLNEFESAHFHQVDVQTYQKGFDVNPAKI